MNSGSESMDHDNCGLMISTFCTAGKAYNVLKLVSSFTSLTIMRFRRFSIVLPKTELLISLQKSCSKSVVAFCLMFVLKVNARFHPMTLVEFEYAMNACQTHSQTNVQLEVDLVSHVLLSLIHI